ncbi:MAG: N-6 DNA methylase, partial [Planctomycetes bacterium]|nr:N-6 DNA methylase [Planctomycetota bacterium]
MRLATPVTAKKTRLPAGAGRAYRKSKRRARGAFCTPPDVADLLARLARGLMTAGPARAGRVLTVLDPACGCGALLAAAARAFPRRRLLLLGIESDRAAAQAAREALAGVGSRVKVKIAVADALRPEPDGRGSEREEPWAARAADLVILNPPFLSYSGREAAPLTAAERAWMRRRFASFRRGWACAHAVFLELALGAARPGGVVAAVLPGQVAFLRRYQPLREAVLHAADRVRVLPLGEGRFPGVVSPTMLLAARVGCRGRGVIIEHFDPGGRRVATGRFPRPDDAVAGAAFLPPVDAAAAAGMRRAPSAGAALLGGAVRDAGVHTGNVARLILADGADAGADQGGVPLIEGRDVVPFHVLPARKRLR